MSNPEAERIESAARELRPQLDAVLGRPAPSFAADLDELLARSRTSDVTPQLVELLTSEEATRRFIDERLSRPAFRSAPAPGYSAMPGLGAGIAPDTDTDYCPKCGYVWPRRALGQPVPACPRDGSELVAVSKAAGPPDAAGAPDADRA